MRYASVKADRSMNDHNTLISRGAELPSSACACCLVVLVSGLCPRTRRPPSVQFRANTHYMRRGY